MKTKFEKVHYEVMSKDPNNWKGVFYVNRKDSRVIVPKITPLTGWTFNFGNPYTYIGLLAIILILIASNYFL
ncbi:MAG: hypothetical protein ABFS35_12720 [Bacteroidota bacterium]